MTAEHATGTQGTATADAQIIDDLRDVYSTLQIANLPAWLDLDLTMAQLKALVTVERNGELTLGGLARELSIGVSAASLLVDHVVRRGYVTRAPDLGDRRRVRIAVTEPGAALLAELRHGRRQILGEWLAQVSPEDQAALAQGLAALARIAAANRRAMSESADDARGAGGADGGGAAGGASGAGGADGGGAARGAGGVAGAGGGAPA